MVQILQSKNMATRFQILVEVAANQPTVHQKSIAARLNVTPQAISEYMMKLEEEGLVVSGGRSKYRVTQEGINWVLQMLREMSEYSDYVQRAITNVTVCAAVADSDLKAGQKVRLQMRKGILVAVASARSGARGTVVSDARKGEDVGISHIEGIVDLQVGQITIAKIPHITKGGSAGVDLGKLKKEIPKDALVGAIGLEAMSALRKIRVEPQYLYGVEAAFIEAAYSGKSSFIACIEDQVPSLIQRLEDGKLQYRILDFCTFPK